MSAAIAIDAGQLGDERVEPIDPTGRDDHRGADRVEHTGEAGTETGRGAGDERDLTVEAEEIERDRRMAASLAERSAPDPHRQAGDAPLELLELGDVDLDRS